MVVLTPSCCRIYRCGRRYLLLHHPTRSFHSALVTCLDDVVKVVRPSVTITKKKFSELPKRRVVVEDHSLPPASAHVQSSSGMSVLNDPVLPSCAQF